MCVEIDQASLKKLFNFIYNHGCSEDKYGENCHALYFSGGKIYAYKQELPYIGPNLETIYEQTNCLTVEMEEEC